MKSKRLISSLMLLIAAFIWGTAFVAQSVGMEHVGPWTFHFSRYVVAAIVLLPFSLIMDRTGEYKATGKDYLKGGAVCGLVLGTASITQQLGMQYTTAGKAGFITTLYVILVPIFRFLLGKKIKKRVWACAIMGIIGLYLISVKEPITACGNGIRPDWVSNKLWFIEENFTIGAGDTMVMVCAVIFALHILVIDHFTEKPINIVKLSNIQTVFACLIGFTGMMLFEKPTFAGIRAAAFPIFYAGALSGGIAYTLQALGQKNTDPTVASLLMSLESVFSVIAGWLILSEVMSLREISGCIVLFIAVVAAQL